MGRQFRPLQFFFSLFLALSLFCGPVEAGDSRDLVSTLARVARNAPAPPAGVSVAVAEEEGSAPLLFGAHEDEALTIASVSKLFSTAAALSGLGKEYQFKTRLFRSGEIVNGMMRGSLLVVGGGDPNISGRFYDNDVNAVFDRWVDGIRSLGITRVSGDLILNSSFFDNRYRNDGWPSGQEARWYQAPVSALSFNDNCVSVCVDPGPRAGTPARVRFEPATDFLQAVSSARTVLGGYRPRVAVARRFGSSVVTVAGAVPLRRYGWSTVIAIDDPPLYFGTALQERMARAGIALDGKILEKPLAPDATWTLVASTTSELVASIAIANKRSQSFYAEQIFKTLAAEKGREGSWQEALRIEKEYIASLHLDPARYDLHDGCGLNRANRVAAGDVVRFLQAVAASPMGEDFIPTLAISGDADGTLRHRTRRGIEKGRVYAKTGTLDGVSSLAGYVTAKSGKRYVFAIVLNGRRASWSGRGYEDRIVDAILEKG